MWKNESYKFCKNCVYCAHEYHSCDFILITGHSRGCPPGEGCVRKRVGKKKPKPMTAVTPRPYKPKIDGRPRYYLSGPEIMKRYERRLALYKQGLNDAEIARELGEKKNAIRAWRKRNSLEANYRREKHGC